MNRHWDLDRDRVRTAPAVRRGERTTGPVLGPEERLLLISEVERLRRRAGRTLFGAAERFIDSLHGPTHRALRDHTARAAAVDDAGRGDVAGPA